jgi:predicted Fe-Mo cluster-binding NifX family protein
MTTIVAVPSAHPGGLEAAVSDHFGHCDVFTLVAVDGGRIEGVRIVPNLAHEQGGCLGPVHYLAEQGARVLIAGGMGMRPLAGFTEAGIMVMHHGGNRSVSDAMVAFAQGQLMRFGDDHTCGGGQGHCH